MLLRECVVVVTGGKNVITVAVAACTSKTSERCLSSATVSTWVSLSALGALQSHERTSSNPLLVRRKITPSDHEGASSGAIW